MWKVTRREDVYKDTHKEDKETKRNTVCSRCLRHGRVNSAPVGEGVKNARYEV